MNKLHKYGVLQMDSISLQKTSMFNQDRGNRSGQFDMIPHDTFKHWVPPHRTAGETGALRQDQEVPPDVAIAANLKELGYGE